MAGFEEYHAELRAVAREILGGSSPLSSGGREGEPPGWDLLARSGWLGLEVPEKLDGAGATLEEVGVILAEMGAAATRSAYLGSTVLGIGLLNLLAEGDLRDDLLRRAASGEVRLAVGLAADEQVGSTPAPFTLHADGGGGQLHGRARWVPDATEADRLLLLARTASAGPCVAVVPAGQPGVTVTGVEVTDPTRILGEVRAEAAEVAEEAILHFRDDPDEGAWRLFDRAALALACDSLGVAETMLNATVGYARAREQFGRPIGSFQAVKHACADMLVQVSVGRELVSAGFAAVVADEADSWVAVSQAKSHVCEAAVEVAGMAMQLHGGIGYTWESGIHVYLKRAVLNRSWFGSPAWHRRRLASRFGGRMRE